jgi:hypothetical protein
LDEIFFIVEIFNLTPSTLILTFMLSRLLIVFDWEERAVMIPVGVLPDSPIHIMIVACAHNNPNKCLEFDEP